MALHFWVLNPDLGTLSCELLDNISSIMYLGLFPNKLMITTMPPSRIVLNIRHVCISKVMIFRFPRAMTYDYFGMANDQ